MNLDPRIIKTKKAIEDAFISLVELKGYSNVKLVDIAKKAKVNRNTIYLHYSSKEEIISSIIATSIQQNFAGIEISSILKYRFNRFKIEAIFRAVFQAIEKRADLYRILLQEDQLVGYFNIEIKKIKKVIYEKVKKTNKNELLITCLVSGIFSILTEYTLQGRGTIEESVKIVSDLSTTLLRKLQF